MKSWKGSLAIIRVAMVPTAMVVLVVGTLALSACAGTTSEHDHADHPHAGETSAAGQPAPNNAAENNAAEKNSVENNAADVTFATDMIPHHEQAVAMAGLVPARSTDPAVIALAREISAAQGPEIETMKGFLVQWNAGPDDHGGAMAGMPMQGMVDDATMNRLVSMTGAEFDTLWLRSMIGHHEGAIAMARTELADGLDPDARTLAQQIVTAQQAEIAQMTEMGDR